MKEQVLAAFSSWPVVGVTQEDTSKIGRCKGVPIRSGVSSELVGVTKEDTSKIGRCKGTPLRSGQLRTGNGIAACIHRSFDGTAKQMN